MLYSQQVDVATTLLYLQMPPQVSHLASFSSPPANRLQSNITPVASNDAAAHKR